MYANGKGVLRDEERAVALNSDAVEQGYTAAQCGLGKMYEQGLGSALGRIRQWNSTN